MMSIMFPQLIQQSCCCNILKINIYCCNNIISVSRFHTVGIINSNPVTSCKSLFYHNPIFTCKIFVKSSFNSDLITFASLIQISDCTGSQITVRKNSSVFSLGNHTSFILSFPENR